MILVTWRHSRQSRHIRSSTHMDGNRVNQDFGTTAHNQMCAIMNSQAIRPSRNFFLESDSAIKVRGDVLTEASGGGIADPSLLGTNARIKKCPRLPFLIPGSARLQLEGLATEYRSDLPCF